MEKKELTKSLNYTVRKYLNKYFPNQYFTENDNEFKSLFMIVRKKHELQRELEESKEILNNFQLLTKKRDVYFLQDDADGYFIKYCEKGENLRLFKVPELIDTKHTDILSAMKFAVEYFKKKDDDFKELINRISGQ